MQPSRNTLYINQFGMEQEMVCTKIKILFDPEVLVNEIKKIINKLYFEWLDGKQIEKLKK